MREEIIRDLKIKEKSHSLLIKLKKQEELAAKLSAIEKRFGILEDDMIKLDAKNRKKNQNT